MNAIKKTKIFTDSVGFNAKVARVCATVKTLCDLHSGKVL